MLNSRCVRLMIVTIMSSRVKCIVIDVMLKASFVHGFNHGVLMMTNNVDTILSPIAAVVIAFALLLVVVLAIMAMTRINPDDSE